MRTLFCLILLCLPVLLNAQESSLVSKKPLDLEAIDNWESVNMNGSISSNGKYVIYKIKSAVNDNVRTIVIQSTVSDWNFKAQISGFNEPFFAANDEYCIFKNPCDSLIVVKLNSSSVQYFSNVQDFTIPSNGQLSYVGILHSNNDFVLYNIPTGKTLFTNSHVTDYKFSNDGKQIVLQTMLTGTDKETYNVIWVDNRLGKQYEVFKGDKSKNFIFDDEGRKLAFLSDNLQTSKLFFCRKGSPAEVIATAIPGNNGRKRSFDDILAFNKISNRVFYNMSEDVEDQKIDSLKAKVDVWTFNDALLQSEQLKRSVRRQSCLYSIDPESKTSYQLTLGSMESVGNFKSIFTQDFSDEFVVVNRSHEGAPIECKWNMTSGEDGYLVSTMNGERKTLYTYLPHYANYSLSLSPTGHYVLYYDFVTGNYCSYNTKTSERKNLTKNIRTEWNLDYRGIPSADVRFLIGIATWIKASDKVLVYDRNDIWLLDLTGIQEPICITNGYGKKNDLRFSLPKYYEYTVTEHNAKLYLVAFNLQNKKNGFYFKDLKKVGDPVKRVMDDCIYYVPRTNHGEGNVEPKKAKKANKWLVGKQSATESLNFFTTEDFKTFRPITHSYPNHKYNWLTTELLEWTMPDGRNTQAVLYKPENFDPAKKYPVIFLYYEKLSSNLNLFLQPERSTSLIDIPYYVSNGYLVVTPDIRDIEGKPGRAAYNAVVSGAEYMAKKSYVNAQKMGLCGHSMGGFKTFYIIAHSSMFAAANALSGASNLTSHSQAPWGNANGQMQVEDGQYNLGASITDRPDLYIENSPLLNTKDVNTPVLMMANYGDNGVNISQSIAFFNALRRVSKRAWMLQYDGHGHFLDSRDKIATTDWTIRQKQFYDHYLKDAPAPVWMTRGVPASKKRIEDGLQLDTEIKTPVAVLGLINPERDDKK